jgi:hypothetical protein
MRKKGWSMRYLRWLQEQQFDHPEHQIILQEMVEAVRLAKERVERLRPSRMGGDGTARQGNTRQTLGGRPNPPTPLALVASAAVSSGASDVTRRPGA